MTFNYKSYLKEKRTAKQKKKAARKLKQSNWNKLQSSRKKSWEYTKDKRDELEKDRQKEIDRLAKLEQERIYKVADAERKLELGNKKIIIDNDIYKQTDVCEACGKRIITTYGGVKCECS
ncbi:hypothetical protein BTR22_07195 [Alkalihalophilus pseudofirmus]|uniref:hypothetical protein n=1 Tax=Alkalihalophilus pseudofirmus TaxID=79885 RepID=UPI000951ED97|nr:hypothetical protein BTR22_07195 [Alkalihalophilus pseudofirmus]